VKKQARDRCAANLWLTYACLLSTKGAYYGAKKQALIKRHNKQARDRKPREASTDKKGWLILACTFLSWLHFYLLLASHQQRR
jgi:hypothetical protein